MPRHKRKAIGEKILEDFERAVRYDESAGGLTKEDMERAPHEYRVAKAVMINYIKTLEGLAPSYK